MASRTVRVLKTKLAVVSKSIMLGCELGCLFKVACGHYFSIVILLWFWYSVKYICWNYYKQNRFLFVFRVSQKYITVYKNPSPFLWHVNYCYGNIKIYAFPECNSTESFRCDGSDLCLNWRYWCDGNVTCPDGSDERPGCEGSSSSKFTCPFNTHVFIPTWVLDQIESNKAIRIR